MRTKHLVIVVQVLVIIIESFLENLDISLVLTVAQTLVHNFCHNHSLITILPIMIITDLVLTNDIETPFANISAFSLEP